VYPRITTSVVELKHSLWGLSFLIESTTKAPFVRVDEINKGRSIPSDGRMCTILL
jgi:hypothetical protein